MNTQKSNQKKNTPILIAPAQFQMEPHNPPIPAAKALHYPLPADRHYKPKLLNIHI